MSSPSQGHEELSPPASAVVKVSILLVEDNRSDILIAKNLLSGQVGMEVEIHVATSLAEATAMLESDGYFDVVLLDLFLSDSSGVDTYFATRSLRPELPCIIYSAMNDEDIAVQLVTAGAQDYLLKGDITSALLGRSIRYAIGRKSILEQLRTTQLQLIQAEKMESVGRLAAGVAHEVKNPLAQIQLGIDYLKRHVSGVNERMPGLLKTMHDAVQRADEVISDLADFSKDRHLELHSCAISSIIESALSLVEHDLVTRHIKLKRHVDEDLPDISCDYRHIEQALVNVMFNAIQAMDSGGTLSVVASRGVLGEIKADDGKRAIQQMRVGDPVVVISITDTGPGIPADRISNVFDPFYTTKQTGVGTGLGLTVVKKIIDLHSGLISIKNLPDSGVECEITLAALL